MFERTSWFAANQKPIRRGVYETRRRGVSYPSYSYWDGWMWAYHMNSVSFAFFYRKRVSRHQNVAWRGLSQKP